VIFDHYQDLFLANLKVSKYELSILTKNTSDIKNSGLLNSWLLQNLRVLTVFKIQRILTCSRTYSSYNVL